MVLFLKLCVRTSLAEGKSQAGWGSSSYLNSEVFDRLFWNEFLSFVIRNEFSEVNSFLKGNRKKAL